MRSESDTAGDFSPDNRSVNDRLSHIENVLTQVKSAEYLNLRKIYVEPPKPRDGDYAYADGTEWAPATAGVAGVYIYNGASWIRWITL